MHGQDRRLEDRSATTVVAGGFATPLPSEACLLVGVTAHRDLVTSEVPGLEAAVTQFLRRLQTLHPALPVAVMSGLAEGGDRLAARCALAIGMPVVAVLPLPIDDYRGD